MSSERYYHLSAAINDVPTDVLISEDVFKEEGSIPESFFLCEAAEVKVQGVVIMKTEKRSHILPEQFG